MIETSGERFIGRLPREVIKIVDVTGRLRPSPDYLVARPALPGRDRRPPPPGVPRRFTDHLRRARLRRLGSTRLQWSALVKVAVLAGLAPDQMTQAVIDAGRGRADRRDPPAPARQPRPGAPDRALFGLHHLCSTSACLTPPPADQP